MMKYGIIGVAAVLLSTAAFAQDAYPTYRHRHHHRPIWRTPPQTAIVAMPSYEPAPRYHQSQASCAPDRGEPVWGEGNAFVGYACVTQSANGS